MFLHRPSAETACRNPVQHQYSVYGSSNHYQLYQNTNKTARQSTSGSRWFWQTDPITFTMVLADKAHLVHSGLQPHRHYTRSFEGHVKVTSHAKRLRRSFHSCAVKMCCRALRKSPSRYISCVVQLFSQSCTKSRLCSERIGPNSSPVLKTRETQTGGPKMPSREGCAFYPFFPISFDKYN